jgi:hypothetical protein
MFAASDSLPPNTGVYILNYCHQLASVVHKLFTFQASSPKPLGQLEPILAGMFLGWSSTRFGADLKSNMAARVHNVF